MTEELQLPDPSVESEEAPKPPVKADERYAVNPNERRFLFVDVAALRAKQLRKGAQNRIELAAAAGEPFPIPPREVGLKAERIAMEEVRLGFVPYELPDGTPLTIHPEG